MNCKDPYLQEYDRYYLMGRTADGLPVILKCFRGEPVTYCVQHDKCRQGFFTLAEALLFIREEWGLKGPPLDAWSDGLNYPAGVMWENEQAANDDPILIRALNDAEEIHQAGLANYEAIYKNQSHFFESIQELMAFVRETFTE